MDFQNKIAVVTGASTGIGKAIAIALAREGAFIYLVARNIEGLAKTKKTIEQNGGKSQIVETDLTNISSINKLVGTVINSKRGVGILVNVAGIWHGENEAYAGKNFESFSQK